MKTNVLKTTRVRFSKPAIALIRPRLKHMANLINAARSCNLPQADATNVPAQGEEIYVERRFDDQMTDFVLSGLAKLNAIGTSRKVSLNSFELAATAASLRDGLNEKAASGEMLALHVAEDLARKFENDRKRAKRAAIGQIGEAAYEKMADRWKHFLEWLRYHLRFELPGRQENKAMTSSRRDEVVGSSRRDEIEAVKALVMQVVTPEADPRLTDRVAELVRDAVRRGTNLVEFPNVSALLEDPEKAREFLANYLRKRKDFSQKLLRPQYQCLAYRQASRHEKLQRAWVKGAN